MPLTVAGLKEALDEADGAFHDPFVIIERDDQEYMQCLARTGWQLEKRDGDEDRHFQARRKEDGEPSAEKQAFLSRILERGEWISHRLDRQDVEAAMTAYLLEEGEPDWIVWTRISL